MNTEHIERLADALTAYSEAEPYAASWVLLLMSADGAGGVLSNIPTAAAQQAMRDYLAQNPNPEGIGPKTN